MINSVVTCAVIIVTYNSQKHIHKALDCLNQQTTLASSIIIVDTGSKDLTYLESYKQQHNVKLIIAEKESGFCKGNNIGMQHVDKNCDYIFFLNPDAFVTPTTLTQAINFMEDPVNRRCGALTGSIIGYDIDIDSPKNAYDSTGVFRTWFGKWYDRDQGLPCHHNYTQPETIPAICGAVFFCRHQALKEVLIRQKEVFDNTFYMYKEDIDLSIRLRKKKWQLKFLPSLIVYHCRGWQQDRSKMLRRFRLCSSKNELRIQTKLKRPIPIFYSLIKFAAVKLLNK